LAKLFEQDNKDSVIYKKDNSLGMARIEALCGRCSSHLGHLFDDGPVLPEKVLHEFYSLDFMPDKE
jgi:peptide methionine sulfoxide reductase MsrB